MNFSLEKCSCYTEYAVISRCDIRFEISQKLKKNNKTK